MNFVAMLGWSPGEDKELFILPELIREFSFERVNKSGAVFDQEKLNWMNQQYIQKLELNDLQQRLNPFVNKTPYARKDQKILRKIIKILQPRLVTLSEIETRLSLFFENNPDSSDPEVLKVLREENSKQVLANFIKQVQSVEKLTKDNLGDLMKNVQNETKIKGKNLWMPLRYAITLDSEGPELNLIVDLFGKERCLLLARSALKF